MTSHGSPAERQAQIRTIVIEHGRFTDAVSALGRFHVPVDGGLHSVGCLSVLIGDSRTGKSFAALRYLKSFPVQVGETGKLIPVIYADMPIEGGGGPRAILENLAGGLDLPITGRMNNPTITQGILRAIVNRGVQHLILDEWDQVFRDNNKMLLGFARGLLRKILNLQTASITCIGLHATYKLLEVDKQLQGRGGLPHLVLRPYDWANTDDRRAFRLLCDSFDERLPFEERSGLGRTGFAERLDWVCGGNIGLLKVMVEAAAALAINDGSPRIELEHFADAYEVRKRPGTIFNPFMHDMTQAPKRQTKGPRGSLKPGPASEVLTKATVGSVRDEMNDAA